MTHRLRLALWFLYAAVFLYVAYGALRDDLALRYPLYYTLPAAVSSIVVTAGVIAYALRCRPIWLVRLSRSLFPVLLAFPLIGLVMDWFLPADTNLKTTPLVVLLASGIVVVLYTPGYLAIWRLGRHDG
jgi:hypothetical protein